MAEPLTISLLIQQITKLRDALPTSNDKRSAATIAEIYFEGLEGISGDALIAAAKTIIREDRYFPRVNRLREVGLKFDQASRAHLPASAVDEQTCPNCRQRYRWERHWRPKMVRGENGAECPELTTDALYFVLVSTERYVCECSARSRWHPIVGLEPAVADVGELLKYHLTQLKLSGWRPGTVTVTPSATSSAA